MRAISAEPGNASARLNLVLAILNSRGRIAFMFVFVIIFVFSILLVGLVLQVVVLTCARAGARGGARGGASELRKQSWEALGDAWRNL